jgi:diacylglycerol kinase family enzyme
MWVEPSNSVGAAGRGAPSGAFFVVANPGSGEHDAQESRESLTAVFGEAGRAVEFVPISGPDALASACKRAAVRARENDGVLVAVGGDGTINTVAQAALAQGCPLGVIPQGTFNLFARDHGIPQDALEAARALVDAQVQPVQVGRLNDRLFLVNASLGLYPQLLQDREAFKEQLGRRRWVAMLAALITVFAWRRQLALQIELDGERIAVRTPTLFVGNNRLQLERIGIEAQAVARVGEGRLAAIVLQPVGTWAMLGLALRGALGRLGEAGQVRSFAFRSLTIRRWRVRRIKVATDGEVHWMRPPLRFEVSPQPLLLMTPQPRDRVAVE